MINGDVRSYEIIFMDLKNDFMPLITSAAAIVTAVTYVVFLLHFSDILLQSYHRIASSVDNEIMPAICNFSISVYMQF